VPVTLVERMRRGLSFDAVLTAYGLTEAVVADDVPAGRRPADRAHGSAEAGAALVRARECDPSPVVRKKAAWYAPGGTLYRRTGPAPVR
jgi:hypothetical protein